MKKENVVLIASAPEGYAEKVIRNYRSQMGKRLADLRKMLAEIEQQRHKNKYSKLEDRS